MLFMLTLLGGRIVPAFTSAGLKQMGIEVRIRRFQPLDKAVLLAVGLVVSIDLISPGGIIAGFTAAISSILFGFQLSRWQGIRTLRSPILWVLHIAYLWLPVCLALKAAWLFGAPIPATSWVHALTIGAFSTMIIGVMSRASLGHTGRPLVTPGAMVIGYLLLSAAALTRVFGPILFPAAAALWPVAAGMFWSLAFLLFVLTYGPILCRPRIDGRPG